MTKALSAQEIEVYGERLRKLLRSNAEVVAQVEREGIAPSGEEHLTLEDEAVDATLLEEDLAALNIESAVAAQINAALARLQNDQYGRCQSCNRWISRERLDVIPFAADCAECAR